MAAWAFAGFSGACNWDLAIIACYFQAFSFVETGPVCLVVLVLTYVWVFLFWVKHSLFVWRRFGWILQISFGYFPPCRVSGFLVLAVKNLDVFVCVMLVVALRRRQAHTWVVEMVSMCNRKCWTFWPIYYLGRTFTGEIAESQSDTWSSLLLEVGTKIMLGRSWIVDRYLVMPIEVTCWEMKSS